MRQERGMAVLMALLLVALAASAAALVLWQQSLWWQQLAAERRRAQIHALTRGGVALAAARLRPAAVVGAGQPWARPGVLRAGEAWAEVRLEDRQGGFNLNALSAGGALVDEGWLAALRRLLRGLGLPEQLALDLARWRGLQTQAEQDAGQRAARGQAPLERWEDLARVPGFTAARLARLAGHAVVLPEGVRRINLNTASAPVLAALLPEVPPGALDEALAVRARQPFRDVAGFLSRTGVSNPARLADLGVGSDYFLARVQVRQGEARRVAEALLKVEPGQTRVLWRQDRTGDGPPERGEAWRARATLRVRADECLQAATLQWAVRDAQDRLLAQGVGPDWPEDVEACELLVPTALLRCAEPELPPGAGPLPGPALGYALEESLANAPEDNRYVRQPDPDRLRVLLVRRAPLEALLDALRARGLAVEKIVPDAMLLPAPPDDGWSVWPDGQGCLLRLDRFRVLRLPAAAGPLAAALAERLEPGRLRVLGEAPLPQAWQALERERLPAPDWRLDPLDDRADLGQDAGRAARRARQWRRALVRGRRVALALAACELALAGLDAGVLLWSRATAERDQRAAALRIGSTARADADPLPGALTALDALRRSRGLPGRADGLALMEALTHTAPPEGLRVQAVDYRAGRLTLVMTPGDEAGLARWRAALASRQLHLSRAEDGRFVLAYEDTAR